MAKGIDRVEARRPTSRIAIELARRGDDPDAAANRLQREADRLTTLVGSLIEVTRLEGDPAAQSATEISVRDRGPGVPDADIPRLAQPFFRVHEARDAASGGVGLGLSIAHRAVQLHHGGLRIENAHPGLRVSLIFPDQRAVERGYGIGAEGREFMVDSNGPPGSKVKYKLSK
jgi:signal transduction histidine kinase